MAQIPGNKMNSSKFHNRFQQVISILLLLAVASMLAWLSTRYDYAADWTANRSNSLTESSVKLLATLKDPVTITAYLYPDQVLRRDITAYIERYQRHKPDISLTFVDPAKAPEKLRELGISASGEVLVEYQGRREKLRVISEPAVSAALQRLSFAGDSWVVFLTGHGERSTEGESQADYGLFAQELRSKGLKVQTINLARTPTLPDNTSTLVIASPQTNLLPGEVQIIRDYIKKGGNLLWLADPGTLGGLQAVAEDIGAHWLNGTLIYPDYQLLGTGHPAVALVMDYGKSPITQDLDNISLFPAARAVQPVKGSAWQAVPLLATPERSWLESGPVQEQMRLDEGSGDVKGPLLLGMSLQRNHPDYKAPEELSFKEPEPAPQQRVVLVGDSDFLSNAYLKELGNQQIGTNIIQWLANRDSQLSIEIPVAKDIGLQVPPWAYMIIATGFIFVLPILLITIGVSRWWLRRRR
jgi:ABC-type uncharacterized transport system involved in gliding motility auxiliary subunit